MRRIISIILLTISIKGFSQKPQLLIINLMDSTITQFHAGITIFSNIEGKKFYTNFRHDSAVNSEIIRRLSNSFEITIGNLPEIYRKSQNRIKNGFFDGKPKKEFQSWVHSNFDSISFVLIIESISAQPFGVPFLMYDHGLYTRKSAWGNSGCVYSRYYFYLYNVNDNYSFQRDNIWTRQDFIELKDVKFDDVNKIDDKYYELINKTLKELTINNLELFLNTIRLIN